MARLWSVMRWSGPAFFFFLCKCPDTTSSCGLQFYFFSRSCCHLLLGLKQGYPFHSPYGCRLGYHQFEAWPVEQKALPQQWIRTHTLLIKHQSLNPVLLSAQPRYAEVDTKNDKTRCFFTLFLISLFVCNSRQCQVRLERQEHLQHCQTVRSPSTR